MKFSINSCRHFAIFSLALFLFGCQHPTLKKENVEANITELQRNLSRGWNTWNTKSVLSHVLLPEDFAINLQLQDGRTGDTLKNVLIGRRGKDVETIQAGEHAYDGSYTDLTLEWHGLKVRIQSAHVNHDMVLLATPQQTVLGGKLLVMPKMLWGHPGSISVKNGVITTQIASQDIPVYTMGNQVDTRTADSALAFSLDAETGISTGAKRTISDIKRIIKDAQAKLDRRKSRYDSLADVYDAMHTVLGWDVIYEPDTKRVITPVSRIWNNNWGGWVLFDWDTYFAAYMYSVDNRDLAYSNAIAITDEITPSGFIPNFASAIGKSYDRSEPPVGSFIVDEIYKQYPEKWFLQAVFNNLLTWNRWWDQHRQVDGYLCWGSDPYKIPEGFPAWLANGVNEKQGAMWESGMDNSPMFDGARFDSTKHVMLLASVGLMSLYIKDCQSLADIATILNKPAITKELHNRAAKYTKSLKSLWSDKDGMFLNKRLDTGKLSHRLSPTLFYPLLAGVATDSQAVEMIRRHFYNPDEFWGKWIMPSIARNDTAYHDNNYWRGRIWAPMNFLVYMGMRNYDNLPEVRKAREDLVEKSKALLLKSWESEGHVYENYNSMTGQGGDVENADKFYHWGALLGMMSLIQDGYVKPHKAGS